MNRSLMGTTTSLLLALAFFPLLAEAQLLNQKPKANLAVFQPDTQNLRKVIASTEGSSDPDGQIESTIIFWGDGSSSQGPVADHEYAQEGSFVVRTEVRDNRGAVGSRSEAISINSLQGIVPVAKIYGTKRFNSGLLGSSSSNDTFSIPVNQVNEYYLLTVLNADGEPHSQEVCAGSIIERAACGLRNTQNLTYNLVNKVTSGDIILNGVKISAGNRLQSSVSKFQTVVRLQNSNSLVINLQGVATSFVQVYVESLQNTSDRTAPIIYADLTNNQITNQKTTNVEIQELNAVNSIVKINGAQVLATTQKDFTFELLEGTNLVYIASTDAYGNQALQVTISNVLLDTVAPVIATSIDSNTIATTGSFNVNITDNLSTTTTVFLNGTQVQTIQSNSFSVAIESGTSNFRIESVDQAGNLAVKEILNVVRDANPPIIRASLASGSSTNKNFFTVEIEDASSVSTDVFRGSQKILTTAQNSFSAPLALAGNDYRIVSTDFFGNSAELLVANILFDQTLPMIEFSPIKISVQDLAQSPSFTIIANEALSSLKADGVSLPPADSSNIVFTYSPNNPQAGVSQVSIEATDLAGNIREKNASYEIVVDTIAPSILIGLENNFKTNALEIFIPVEIQDANQTFSTIVLDDVDLFSTTAKVFQVPISTMSDGPHVFKVRSTDEAGNIAVERQVTFIRDTTPPLLSNLVPANNSEVTEIMFTISGQSNEPLGEVKADGRLLQISEDKLSFSGSYVASRVGFYEIQISAKDVLGNERVIPYQLNLNVPLLNPMLISIAPDSLGRGLIVGGASGAVRPGARIEISEGFFSFNSNEGIAEADGSFALLLKPFTTAQLNVTDLNNGDSQEITLSYANQTTLSGIIKDTNDVPLPGATVRIENTQFSTLTDSNGLFNFINSATGDQVLVIDGSTIPASFTGPNRKFFVERVPINIGMGQNNVIPRPIYLNPLLMDGSQTTVVAGVAATVESVNAPGVRIEIPANAAMFPSGSLAGDINISMVPSNRTTYPVPAAAVPDFVVSLEPSGLRFTEPVELTIPNTMEMPPETGLLIVSLNTANGTWEVDGLARVTQDGQSIKTVPGKGISHFSPKYAVPSAPLLTVSKDPNLAGINVSKEGVATNFSLPSFKIADSSVTPTLSYNSNWAKPMAFVSTFVDIPDSIPSVSLATIGSDSVYYDHKATACVGGKPFQICFTKQFDHYYNTYFDLKVDYKAWYVPQKITSQFFVSSLKTMTAVGSDANSSSTTIFEDLQAGTVQVNGQYSNVKVQDPFAQFGNELPGRFTLSYSADLKDTDTGDFFESGRYPSLTRYKFKLKGIEISTTSKDIRRNLTISGEIQKDSESVIREKTTSINTQVFDSAFPRDLGADILVQNHSKSPAGSGWKYGDNQRILGANSLSSTLLIEESSGALSTYGLANNISTVFHGGANTDQSYVDLTQAIDISDPTDSFGVRKTQTQDEFVRINFSNVPPTIVKDGNVNVQTGSIIAFSTEIYNACKNGTSSDVALNDSRTRKLYGSTATRIGGITRGPNGDILIADQVNHDITRVGSQSGKLIGGIVDIDQRLARENGGAPFLLTGPLPLGGNLLIEATSQGCRKIFGRECIFRAPESYPEQDFPQVLCSRVRNNTIPFNWKTAGNIGDPGTQGNRLLGFSGELALTNSPGSILFLNQNEFYYADTGNNLVKKANLQTGEVQTVAGNGQNFNFPMAGGTATDVPIHHPKSLALDAANNLYISTEDGNILKLDQNNFVQKFAGTPLAQGGLLADQGSALQIAFENPSGIFIDKNNLVMYVADTGFNRVMRINMVDGTAMKVAGSGSCNPGQLGDGGSAVLASLCSPTQVSLDTTGDLMIVDSGNNRIRKVNLSSAGNSNQMVYAPSNHDGSSFVRKADGNWERRYREGHIAHFSPTGKQTSLILRDGRETRFEYSPEGHLTKTIYFTGQEIQYRLSGNELSEIIDPAGRRTSFSYSNGRLASVSYPDSSQKKYGYNGQGLLESERDQKNQATVYSYTYDNRLQSVLRPDQSKIEFESAFSQPLGDEAGTLIKTALPSQGFGNTVKDPKGNTTKIVPFIDGILSEVTDALGNTTIFERNELGQTTSVIRPNAQKVKFEYDPITRDLVKETEFVGENPIAFKKRVIDSFGNLLSEVNTVSINATPAEVQARTTVNQYYANGLLFSQTQPNGNRVEYYYNSMQLMVEKRTINGSQGSLSTFYTRDHFGRIMRIVDPAGIAVDFEIDDAGNIASATKKISQSQSEVTHYSYDSFNRLTKVTSPKNEITEYSYSLTGELLQIKDPKEKLTIFEYDIVGQLKKKTDQLGREFTFSYDQNGNRVSEKDPNGNLKTYSYDELNRISKAVLPDDVLEYSYNSVGDLVSLSNSNSLILLGYDTRRQVIETQTQGQGSLADYPVVPLQLSYDIAGNRREISSSLGAINYQVDNLNRLTSINSFSGQSFSFTYDEVGRISQVSRPGSRTNYTFMGSQLASIIHSSSNVTKSFFDYAYDSRGLPVQKRTIAGNIDYGYDQNGQLTSSAQASVSAESFVYDSLGNRTQDSGGSSSYDPSGQRLTEDWQFIYLYDNNGNLTVKNPKDSTKKAFQFEYTSSNQLKRINILENPFGQIIKRVEFFYDAQGRRMQKQVQDLVDSSKSYKRKFIYDGDNVMLEYNSENESIAKYTHSPLSPDDILSAEITSAGVTAGLASTAGAFYYMKDHLGSITDIANSAGQILQRIHYNAFGGIRAVTDAAGADIADNLALNTSYTFTGREKEDEIPGLYYYRSRYYDSTIGRFLQEDSHPGRLTNPLSFTSKYVYTQNRPTQFIDPDGRNPFLILLGLSALAGGLYADAHGLDFAKGALVAALSFTAGFLTGGAFGALFGSTEAFLGYALAISFGALAGGIVGAELFPALGLGSRQAGFDFGAIFGAAGGLTGLAYTDALFGKFFQEPGKAFEFILSRPIPELAKIYKGLSPLFSFLVFELPYTGILVSEINGRRLDQTSEFKERK